MLHTFEEYTQDLTAKDMEMLPHFVDAFASKTPENPVKSAVIEAIMPNFLKGKGIDSKVPGTKVRKIVHHIRANAMLPLCSTKDGYFCSHKPEHILATMKHLEQRASSMMYCYDGLNRFIPR
jgi:hypothetical protein